jgi:hypothetical protein
VVSGLLGGGAGVRGLERGVVSELTRKCHDSGGSALKNHQIGSPPSLKV